MNTPSMHTPETLRITYQAKNTVPHPLTPPSYKVYNTQTNNQTAFNNSNTFIRTNKNASPAYTNTIVVL